MRYVNGKPVKTDPELLNPEGKKYRNKKSNKYYRNIAGALIVGLGGITFVLLTNLEVSIGVILIVLALIAVMVFVLFDMILKYDIGFVDGEKPSKDDPTREAREAVLHSMMKD